jgi:hypothetical protein
MENVLGLFRFHAFDHACEKHGIDQRPPQNALWRDFLTKAVRKGAHFCSSPHMHLLNRDEAAALAALLCENIFCGGGRAFATLMRGSAHYSVMLIYRRPAPGQQLFGSASRFCCCAEHILR